LNCKPQEKHQVLIGCSNERAAKPRNRNPQDNSAHLHQAVAMPQQVPQKPILCVRYSAPRETVIDREPQQELRILAIRLLRWRTRFVRISATSPIHNSNCNSLNKSSNLRARRCLPFPVVLANFARCDCGRTAQLLRGESAVQRTPRFLCPRMQFTGSADDIHNL